MSMDTEQIIREYIGKSVHMSLATVSGDQPWVCEVHCAYDDDLNLYFRSSPRRRHSQEIAANPKVAGNIVGQHALGEDPHGIYYEGTAEILTTNEQRQAALPFFIKCLGKSDGILEEAQDPNNTQFYKITVKNWYAFGKFGDAENSKRQLVWNGGAK